jgi:hypothetical protein
MQSSLIHKQKFLNLFSISLVALYLGTGITSSMAAELEKLEENTNAKSLDQYNSKFTVLGELTTPLASYLSNYLTEEKSSKFPVLLENNLLLTENTDYSNTLKKSYESGDVIAVFSPNFQGVSHLFNILGIKEARYSDNNKMPVEIYAFRKTSNGTASSTFFKIPNLPHLLRTELASEMEEGYHDFLQAIQKKYNNLLQSQTASFMEWIISQQKDKNTETLQARFPILMALPSEDNIYQMVKNDHPSFYMPTPYGEFKCTPTTFAVSVQKEYEDIKHYYYVGVQTSFTPVKDDPDFTLPRQSIIPYHLRYEKVDNGWLWLSDGNPATYKTSDVNLKIIPTHLKDSADAVLLIKSEPYTTEGSASTSSSMSYHFSGNVGFFGKTPTGGLSGGAGFSISQSFSLPGVVIENKSNKTANAQWYLKIHPDSPVATSTLQCYLQGLWCANFNYLTGREEIQYENEETQQVLQNTDAFSMTFEVGAEVVRETPHKNVFQIPFSSSIIPPINKGERKFILQSFPMEILIPFPPLPSPKEQDSL